MAGSADSVTTARPRWLLPFGAFAVVFFVAAQALALLLSPPDQDMGDLQKIMYVHVPTAWIALLGPALVFVASVLYLWKRRANYDLLAASGAEVSVVLMGLTIVQGSIWARPTWGIWWTWDARLTSMAVLFLFYAGYMALRAFVDDDDRRARWSAAVGIFGFLIVPIVYMSVIWWRTLHQRQSTPETVDSLYRSMLQLNAFAVLFLFIFLVGLRYHSARLERARATYLEEVALIGREAHV